MRYGLAQFGKPVDDTEPYFIANLHLHHFGREACTHPLSVLQIELHLSSAPFDEVEQEHRGKPLKFFIGRMLAHVEDLGHASRPFVMRP